MEIDSKKIKALQSEKQKLMKYISRSQKAIARNMRRLKRLEREQEILLNPCLPGLQGGYDEENCA